MNSAYHRLNILVLLFLSTSVVAGERLNLSVHRLDSTGEADLVEAKSGSRWIQFRDVLIRETSSDHAARFTDLEESRLALHGMGCDHGRHAPIDQVLWDDGRFALVYLSRDLHTLKRSPQLRAVPWGAVISQRYQAARGAVPADPQIEALVDLVNGDRWFADVVTLANWDRHSRSVELPLARDWIQQQLDAMPGMITSIQSFSLGGDTAWNVIGRLDGSVRPGEWYIVGGHYDSRRSNGNLTSPTPGAEDNASGCAGVLEVARILSDFPPEATVFFACYSGEEQGLIGSNNHAQSLVDDGTASLVQFMLNMDMIGYSADASLDALFESEGAGVGLIDTLATAATTYTALNAVTSTFSCCSDHMPYINRGIPAILSIEDDWNIYPHYHTQTDLPENMNADFNMGREIIKTNLAVLAQAAGSSIGRVFKDGFESAP